MEQVNVSGTVVDKESNEQLTGASVIVKGADGKIKKFTTSKGDGGFAMSLPMVEGCRLEVNIKSDVSVTIHRFFYSKPHSSGR
ncbi:MAG: carboxypeptidase-like regulatory domain-containing protein [Muribaculaceae bacterium]|nr:carboxypeptidase-like regulatory domain-containing protein [Muribaculaceae bacterium]